MFVKDKKRRSAVWHLRSARMLLRSGEEDCAITEIKRLLEKSGKNGIHSAGAFLIAVDALTTLKRYDEARDFTRVGLLAWPHLTGFAARLVRLDLLRGNIHQAIAGAGQLLLNSPYMKSHLLETLGDGYRILGQYGDSIQVYRTLLAKYNDTHNGKESLLARMGEVCYGVGYYDEGLQYLEMMQQPSVVLQAQLLHGAGRLIEALDIYDVILTSCGLVSIHDEKPSVFTPSLSSACSVDIDHIDEDTLLDISLKRVDVLDRLGRISSLEKLACWEMTYPSQDARVRIKLGRALVKRGCAALAVRLIRKDRNNPAYRRVVHGVILCAAEIEGRDHLANLCMKRLIRYRGTVLRAERDSVFGRLLRGGKPWYADCMTGQQNDRSDHIPDTSIPCSESPLTRLVHHACRALEQAGRNENGLEEYEIHLSRCRGVLHRDDLQVVSHP